MNYKTYREKIAEQERIEKQENLKANIIGFIVTVLYIGAMFFFTSLK